MQECKVCKDARKIPKNQIKWDKFGYGLESFFAWSETLHISEKMATFVLSKTMKR